MRVLIIDDEPLVRRSLSRALRSAGHVVVEAVDGDTGLTSWLQNPPDLAFVDVLMPGLTGPQLLQSLPKEVRAKTRVIMMSAFVGQEGLTSATIEGADHFLPKPFDDIFGVVRMAEGMMKNG